MMMLRKFCSNGNILLNPTYHCMNRIKRNQIVASLSSSFVTVLSLLLHHQQQQHCRQRQRRLRWLYTETYCNDYKNQQQQHNDIISLLSNSYYQFRKNIFIRNRYHTSIGTRLSSNTTTTNTSTTSSSTDSNTTNNHTHHNHNQVLHYKYIYPSLANSNDDDDSTSNNNSIPKNDTTTLTSNNTIDTIFIFLHGLFGQGRNLTTLAQQVLNIQQQQYVITESSLTKFETTTTKATCVGILIDLYGHGKSQPITLQSNTNNNNNNNTSNNENENDIDDIQEILSSTLCATIHHCVLELIQERQQEQQVQQNDTTSTTTMTRIPKLVLIGHSLGGRVALQFIVQALIKGNKLKEQILLQQQNQKQNQQQEQHQQHEQMQDNEQQQNEESEQNNDVGNSNDNTVSGQQQQQQQSPNDDETKVEQTDTMIESKFDIRKYNPNTGLHINNINNNDTNNNNNNNNNNSNTSSNNSNVQGTNVKPYAPLHIHHIWLLDTVPNKPDLTVQRVLRSIQSIMKRQAEVKQIILKTKQNTNLLKNSNNGNIDDNETMMIDEMEEETILSRNDIRQSMMQFNNNIPISIIEWISSQWLVKEQRFVFDIHIIQNIVTDLLNNDNYDINNQKNIDPRKDGGMFGVKMPSVSNKKKRANVQLTFWEQINYIILHTRTIQIFLVQAGNNKAWNYKIIQEPLQNMIHDYLKYETPRVQHYIVPNAGHWVHVDNLTGLMEIISSVYTKPKTPLPITQDDLYSGNF